VTASSVGGTCPARPEDLPEIVALFARVYPRSAIPADRLTAHLQRILVEHPWHQLPVSSLACRDRAGRLVGFLGALPRPMTAAGRPVLMAVGHHFMVDPEHRGTLAALQLLRAFLAGPQDLSMCESNSDVRKLWHAVGGTTSHLYSPTWTRPLRPAKYFASLLRQRGRLGAVAAALSPACWLFDRVATANRSSPYYLAPGDWTLDEVNADALVDHIHRLSEPCYLRPQYDAASLTWLLALLRARRSIGSLEVRLVRRPTGDVLGYFVYVAVPGGTSQVVQIGARNDTMGDLFRALAVDASQRHSIALSGRLDPRYLSEMTGASSIKHTGNWLLIHTRDAALERAIHMGDAFLTRLESEWWLPFQD
jgi:Acetyltransferase (GNAT) domain